MPPPIACRLGRIDKTIHVLSYIAETRPHAINLLGQYAFLVPNSVERSQLRPLRNPDEALEDVA
jgi:hypothetical protein